MYNPQDKFFKKVSPEIFDSYQDPWYSKTKTFKVVNDACNFEREFGRIVIPDQSYDYQSCIIERFKKAMELKYGAN